MGDRIAPGRSTLLSFTCHNQTIYIGSFKLKLGVSVSSLVSVWNDFPFASELVVKTRPLSFLNQVDFPLCSPACSRLDFWPVRHSPNSKWNCQSVLFSERNPASLSHDSSCLNKSALPFLHRRVVSPYCGSFHNVVN